MEMRQALQEKEDQKTLKAKMRERVRPKMGKIDIDYQKLHDAFFKWQSKPKMTIHGDLYYEVCFLIRMQMLLLGLWLVSAEHRCTCLQTFTSPPRMVTISAHLHIDHSLFHGPEPPLVTEASLPQDCTCGTVCRLLCDRSPAIDSLGDI